MHILQITLRNALEFHLYLHRLQQPKLFCTYRDNKGTHAFSKHSFLFSSPPKHEESNEGVGGTPHRRRDVEVPAAEARPEHDGRHDGRGPADEVDAAAARDVDDVKRVEEARALPEPVRGHAVHDGVDEREEAVGVEITPALRDK